MGGVLPVEPTDQPGLLERALELAQGVGRVGREIAGLDVVADRPQVQDAVATRLLDGLALLERRRQPVVVADGEAVLTHEADARLELRRAVVHHVDRLGRGRRGLGGRGGRGGLRRTPVAVDAAADLDEVVADAHPAAVGGARHGHEARRVRAEGVLGRVRRGGREAPAGAAGEHRDEGQKAELLDHDSSPEFVRCFGTGGLVGQKPERRCEACPRERGGL